jgi:hypothetical protein
MEKVTIELIYGTGHNWGNEYAVVKLHGIEKYRTGWYSNGAKSEAESWCRSNGYLF